VRVAGGGRNRQFFLLLLVIAGVGLIWRIAYLVWMRDVPVQSDGIHYHVGALGLVDGAGWMNPISVLFGGRPTQDAVHPPAWQLLLAGSSALGLRSYLSHQMVAAVVGAGTIFMTGLAAREAFGRRVGLIAAALTAAYANVWLYERDLFAEPLALLGVATLLWLVYRFRAHPGTWGALAIGLCLGVLAMTRSEQVLLGVILVVPLVLGRTAWAWSRRVLWLAVAGAACVVVIAPWAIFNSTRFEEPVPLSTGLGGSMLAGNCPPTYYGENLGYMEPACLLLQRNLSPEPSVADGQMRRRAFAYMSADAGRVPVVMAARIGRTFGVYRPAQQMTFETERGSELWVIQLATVMYWVLLPLAVFGAVLARRRHIPIYPLLVIWVAIIVSVAFTIGAIRYRAPTEIPMVILAAVSFDWLIRAWSRRRSSAQPAKEPLRPDVPVPIG